VALPAFASRTPAVQQSIDISCPPGPQLIPAWASAHRGKCGQLTGQMGSADPPGKMDEQLKSENMQKKSMFMLYFESNQGRQV